MIETSCESYSVLHLKLCIDENEKYSLFVMCLSVNEVHKYCTKLSDVCEFISSVHAVLIHSVLQYFMSHINKLVMIFLFN